MTQRHRENRLTAKTSKRYFSFVAGSLVTILNVSRVIGDIADDNFARYLHFIIEQKFYVIKFEVGMNQVGIIRD